MIDQIGKIGTEEFNPVILIISGLDIALLFSGPLKPALSVAFKPLKKLAANPAILKVMKILGPFFGNVIKKVGDSKSIDPILNLLPFFMILGEIAADEEARQAIPIIVDAISSSEDLEAWFEYFRLPSDGWTRDEIPELELDLAANDSVRGLPLSGLMNQAYAVDNKKFKRLGGKEAADKLIKALKDIRTGSMTPQEGARVISLAIRELVFAAGRPGVLKSVLTSRSTLTAASVLAAHGGHTMVKNLLGSRENGRKSSRTPLFLQIAAIAYFESRFSSECTEYCIGDPKMISAVRTLYSLSFGHALIKGWSSAQESGYQFHLTMAALMHLWGETGASPYGKLSAVEKEFTIPFWYQNEGDIKKFTKHELKRRVDLVTQLEGEDRPRFIELKSYSGQKGADGKLTPLSDKVIQGRFKTWNMLKTTSAGNNDQVGDGELTDGGNHRQYVLDKIASTNNSLITKDLLREKAWQAKKIHWFFQDYKHITVGGLTSRQVGLVADQLAIEPKSQPSKKLINISLGAVPYTKPYNLTQAKKRANLEVKLFNIKTILQNSGSVVVDKLFDMAELKAEDKARLKLQIDNLILKELP